MKTPKFSRIAVLLLLAPAVVMGQGDVWSQLINIVGEVVSVVNAIAGPVLSVFNIDFEFNVQTVVGTFLDIVNTFIPEVPSYGQIIEQICVPLETQISDQGASIGLTCSCGVAETASGAVSVSIEVSCAATAEVCLTADFCGPPTADAILNLDLGEQNIGTSTYKITASPANFCIAKTGTEASPEVVCADFPLQAAITAGDFANPSLTIEEGTSVEYTKDGTSEECAAPTVPCSDTDPLTVQLDCSAVGGPTSTCKTIFFEDAAARERRALSGNSKTHLDTILNSMKKESNQDFYIA